MGLEALADENLMERVQAGDREAFRVLYTRHHAAAENVARSTVPGWAPEAVQDGFATAWRASTAYRPGVGSVRGWILTIVRRRALDLARAEARRGIAHDDESLTATPAPVSLEDDAIARSEAAQIRAALGRLPRSQREVIALAYFGGLTQRQIAGRLDLPEGTVKGRMRLGFAKLRDDAIGTR